MKLPKEGADGLPTDGLIESLKVIFQGSKGPKNVKIGCFATFWPIFSKTVW